MHDKMKETMMKNFKEEVLDAKGVVLIDFFAKWCGPCKLLAPIIEEIAQEDNGIKVFKVDIDEESELASQFNIMSIPTLIVMEEGKIKQSMVGYKPKKTILESVGL